MRTHAAPTTQSRTQWSTVNIHRSWINLEWSKVSRRRGDPPPPPSNRLVDSIADFVAGLVDDLVVGLDDLLFFGLTPGIL